MGSRKEILKKSLGISEYPWSSDDDLDESTNPTNTDHGSLRRQQEPRTSTADMPGTSGLQSQSTSQQTPPRRSSSCSKMDRNLFWSMLNSPHQVPPNPPPTVNRPRMEPVQMPRIPVAPPNPSEREHYAIQRIITLRRLTRDLDERLATSATLNNILHGTPLPRGSGNIQNPSRPYYPKKYHYPFRRSPTTRNLLACFARTGRGQVSHDPTMDEPLALTTHNAPITIRDSVNRDHHPMPPLHSHHNISFNNSEDDLDNPGPSTSNHAPTEEVNLTNDEPDAPPLTPPMNTSAMSLEEEIVEIDADDAPADQTIDLDDDNAQRFDYQPPTGDPNVASTSSDNAEAQEQQPPNQGVKRKRRNSDDNPEPFTVKEFNQNLLRLLECPVCLEWMEPPMSQCRRGHLVCARCRARLAACPVCRTTFSSVRNRAMEGVAEMLRYPCRHGCGRSVRQRRRAPHEDSCPRRAYACPAPACRDAPPLQRDMLPEHFQSRHLPLLKIGVRHKFTMKMNSEQHDHWILLALDQYFHLRVEVGLRVIVCVALIGPKCDAKRYLYQVTVDGHHNRKMVYTRAAHSDLESSFNMAKQDCFHLSREQALTFVRVKNRHSNVDKLIDLTVELSKVEVAEIKDDSDS